MSRTFAVLDRVAKVGNCNVLKLEVAFEISFVFSPIISFPRS